MNSITAIVPRPRSFYYVEVKAQETVDSEQIESFSSIDLDEARTSDDILDWSRDSFDKAPRATLSRAILRALQDKTQAKLMTEAMFPLLFEETPARRRLVYAALRSFADPQDILWIAWRTFQRVGDVEHLATAAALLEDLGACSWNTLRAFARLGVAEASYFVPAIARLTGIRQSERVELLAELATSLDSELRWQVYETLEHFPVSDGLRLLKILAQSECCEDSAKSAAEERLGSTSD